MTEPLPSKLMFSGRVSDSSSSGCSVIPGDTEALLKEFSIKIVIEEY